MNLIKKFKDYYRGDDSNGFGGFDDFVSQIEPYFYDVKDNGWQVHYINGDVLSNKQEIKDRIGRGTLDLKPQFDEMDKSHYYVIIEPPTKLRYSGMFGHHFFIDDEVDIIQLENDLKEVMIHLSDYNKKVSYSYIVDPKEREYKRVEGVVDITSNVTFKKLLNKIPTTHVSPETFIRFWVKIEFGK